jgi:prefoldin subunit 5
MNPNVRDRQAVEVHDNVEKLVEQLGRMEALLNAIDARLQKVEAYISGVEKTCDELMQENSVGHQ